MFVWEGGTPGPLRGAALREYRDRDLVTAKGRGRARISLEMNEQLDDFALGDAVVERDPQLAAQRRMRAPDRDAPTMTAVPRRSCRSAATWSPAGPAGSSPRPG